MVVQSDHAKIVRFQRENDQHTYKAEPGQDKRGNPLYFFGGLETMKKIVVEEQNGKYVVHLEEDESIWSYGNSKQEAIGEMIVTCHRRLDFAIEYKGG